ncbi:MAG: ABC transporter permease [Lachnospiraceae bacterium]|nr:ABC transporter permease [Lachnospiraceae bacterium]
MWREYSSGYLKHNRAAAGSVMTAAFISSLLLSLLSSLFYNMWKYEVERLRAEGDQYALMAMYLARDANDEAPRLVFPLFLLIMGLASFSLIVIIHNAFAVSMQARIHQFGILASIGATPKQIRRCLLQEAAFLCAAPVLAGTLLGIAGCKGILALLETLMREVEGRRPVVFGYHPLILVLSLFATGITVGLSVWLPARKLSVMTPLEAVKNTGELQLKRKKHSPVLLFLFGVEGELAGNALKAQRKALRTAAVSLLFSMTAFTLMQCFFTLSEISTRETYFEKYQDAWDIMVTVKDTEIGDFGETERLREIPGVENVIVYQKAMAKSCITEEEMSEEMKANGGFSHDSGKYVTQGEAGFWVNAPVMILDDAAFLEYCERIDAPQRTDGAVIRNRICDVTNPDFRHPQYMPYIRGGSPAGLSAQTDREAAVEISALAYTDQVPVLREEYATLDKYELVHFVPVSLWKEVEKQIGGAEKDTLVRILCREGVSLEELDRIQAEIEKNLAGTYTTESENRIREYETNDQKIQGMMVVLGSFCVLLALIGVGDVFSNTLGFVQQRKREFARYLSVGMTPRELRKMFCIEAFALAGRPMLWAAAVAFLAVGAMLKASYVDAAEFLAEAPFFSIGVFMLAVGGTVAFAYYVSWRKMRKLNLAEVLRDDTMM